MAIKNVIFPERSATAYTSLIIVTLEFSRRTLFNIFNLVLPGFVISLMCVIGFILPVNSGEKTTLQSTNVLCLVFANQYVSTITPANSLEISKISYYYLCVGGLALYSTITCAISTSLVRFEESFQEEMPYWFETLTCVWMAKLLRMKPNIPMGRKNKVATAEQVTEFSSEIDLKKSDSSNTYYMKKISEDLALIKKQITDIEKNSETQIKWVFCGAVFDRFNFCITAIYSVVTFLAIILADPNFYNFN